MDHEEGRGCVEEVTAANMRGGGCRANAGGAEETCERGNDEAYLAHV
jgi:hypothetical protein